MRRINLSFTGIALATLAFSCSSDDPGDSSGTGGSGMVGTGSAPANAGGTDIGIGGTGGPGGSGASANVGGGFSAGGGGGVDGGGGLGAGGIVDPSAGGALATAGGTAGGGGSDTSTGGQVSVPKPPLVVSGDGAYWQIKTEADLAPGTAATITVNTGDTDQTWKGFGGTFNEQGWAALQSLTVEQRQEVIRLLFDRNDGIGLDWGRIPIGPSDYALERYTLSNGPGEFDITHDMSTLIPYIQEAQKVKADVKFWASPWSPPPWAKSDAAPPEHVLENGGYDKGIFNTTYYQEYADYFVDWIQAYQAQGITIDYVMPQNEPGWAQSYPTAAFGPAKDTVKNVDIDSPLTLGTFVNGYLFPSLAAAGLDTQVWFGTLSNPNTFEAYWGDMISQSSADQIQGVGLQWETQKYIGTISAAKPNYLIMQSEHKCGNYPWAKGETIPEYVTHKENQPQGDTAPNDYNYGRESWDLLKSWIDDGVHIYSAWNMVLDLGGANLDINRRWHQNALIKVDTNGGVMTPTPYYYVFRHIAQYTDVDAVRVGVTGNAIAFRNPDGSVMTAIFNESASPSATTLSVDGNMVAFEIPAGGWATVNM